MKRTNNKAGGHVVTKRGNTHAAIITKEWSKSKIGYHKMLLDQRAKKNIHHVTHEDKEKNCTVTYTYINTVSEKLISLAYRTNGDLYTNRYHLKVVTISRYSLNDHGKQVLKNKRKQHENNKGL